MIGGVYKLEQKEATFLTLFEQDRYIIVEQSRGLTRYYVLSTASGGADEFGGNGNGSFGAPQIYNLIHYVVPSVPESARVYQQVNKRSIDQDVKELFAMKNMAHFTYENE